MRAASTRPSAATAGLLLLGLATVVSVPLGEGNLGVALAPLVVVLVGWALLYLPLRRTLLGLLVLVLCVDSPFEVPFANMWRSPLDPIARLLYENLHRFTGIGALRFSLLVTLLVALLGLAIYRRARGIGIDRDIVATPRCLQRSLALSFAALLFLELMGLARGGNFKESLWQVETLLFIPILAELWQLGARGPKDHRALGIAILFSACFKTFLGAYFLYFVARPQGLQPPYVTQHTDTLLFVTAIVIVAALWMERPSLRHTVLAALVVPVVTWGIVINERRLAYVSLAACLFTIFAISPWSRGKRWVTRAGLALLPLVVLYFAAGWSSSARIFKPVQAVRSVVAHDANADTQADSSTEFRDMENYNLIRTWMPNPILGSGFGHEYSEVIKLPDISKYFPTYRYVPHNSVLWIWGIGGLLGYSAVWSFLAISILLAARGFRAARSPIDRAAALTCICVVVAFLNQAFGDMGTQSWITVFLVAPAVVTAGKLAVATGAWPAPVSKGVARQPVSAIALPPEVAT